MAIHKCYSSYAPRPRQQFCLGYERLSCREYLYYAKLPFEENVALSKLVVEDRYSGNVPVEAELGKVGGKEAALVVESDIPYTAPEEAGEFVKRTGIASLAVGIGTAHGVYKGEPNVNVGRLHKICVKVDIPLVLHGTSGVPEKIVQECIANGICKVNYATDLRVAFSRGVKGYLKNQPDTFDPKKYNAEGRRWSGNA